MGKSEINWKMFFRFSSNLVQRHASQEQTHGGKKRPSAVNPLGMLYIVLGTIRAKYEKNQLGNTAFVV